MCRLLKKKIDFRIILVFFVEKYILFCCFAKNNYYWTNH